MNGLASTHTPDPNYPHPFWTPPANPPYITPETAIGSSRLDPGTPTTPRPWTPAPSDSAAPRQKTKHPVIAFVVGFFVCIATLDALAPHSVNRPVSPSVITSSPISGGPCDPYGGVRSAVETDTAGPYPVYSVTCADGVVTAWAGP